MSCDTYFNIFDLQGSSLETEVGWSTFCIPNRVKFAILLVLLISNVLTLAVSIFYFTREANEVKNWTLRKKVFALSGFGVLAQTILICLHLAGVESRARYLLFPILGSALTFNSGYMIKVFIRVFASSIQNAKDDWHLLSLQRMYYFYVYTDIGLTVLFHTILCMIYYDDPYMLNWFYTIAITIGLLGSVLGSGSFIFVWYRLAKLCVGSPGIPVSPDLEELRIKLERRVYLAASFTAFPILLLFFPVWMGVTGVDSANPGMQGHFYFNYCYIFPYNTLAAVVMIFLVLKAPAASRITTGSQNNEGTRADSSKGKRESSTTTGNFASFTIEELNATSSP